MTEPNPSCLDGVTSGAAHQRRLIRLGGHAEVSCVCGWGVEVHGRSGDDAMRLVDKAFRDHVTLPVLSLWQPWASLVAMGIKTAETRGRAAPKKYIGRRIAIHATARRPDVAAIGEYGVIAAHDAAKASNPGIDFCLWSKDGWVPLPLGAIVCTVILAASVPITAGTIDGQPTISQHGDGLWQHDGWGCWSLSDQLPYGDFTPGRHAYLLTDLEPVDPPVPFVGGQGWSKRWTPDG